MYKLFLCLRYLRSRSIAYFAMMAVALCVAMMLIVVSVMNGFLHKIEQAAKALPDHPLPKELLVKLREAQAPPPTNAPPAAH